MALNTLGILAAFLAIAVGLLALQDFALERRQIFKNLRSVRQIELSPTDVRQRELAKPFMQRVAIPALKGVGSLGRRFTPPSVIERLSKELVYAGSPAGWDGERVLAMKLLSMGVLGVGLLFLTRIAHTSSVRSIIIAALGAVIGYYGPEWILRSKSGTRQGLIQRTLPDSLDLLSITVEAGLGFDAAVARVARQAGGPLGEE